MPTFVVFRLYGPMCSWGEIAVGETRHTADHPSRSALLGLVAAALGIERGEEERQAELSAACRFGIKLLTPGTLLRDYHTVQAPRSRKGVRHRTRRSELLAPAADINTLLSSREYRTDSISVVAAELLDGSRWTAESIAAALREPVFPLYLGRKSCPIALPLAPHVVQAATLREALDGDQLPLPTARPRQAKETVARAPWPADGRLRGFHLRGPRYFWESGTVLEPIVGAAEHDGNAATTVEFVRHDQPLSRRRWQFRPRREFGYFAPEPDQRQTGTNAAPAEEIA